MEKIIQTTEFKELAEGKYLLTLYLENIEPWDVAFLVEKHLKENPGALDKGNE